MCDFKQESDKGCVGRGKKEFWECYSATAWDDKKWRLRLWWLSLSCHEPNGFSERAWHYHTAGKAAFPLSFHLSPAVPIQPSIFFFISLCHLALALKFIYVLFLSLTSLSLLSLSLFALSVSFFLPVSPILTTKWISILSFFFFPFPPFFPDLTAVLQLYMVFPQSCWLQMENVWLSRNWVLCKQSYCMSSSQLHQDWL